ncbi:MAG TPA: FecR domain-containing protein [Gammaproteobacteria bacterium]|nr:FecR domain-containing protein [Gammaproteobacteria bacterium]
MNEALARLATADPRLKAMVDQAASSGATLPDDEPEEPPAGKPPPLTITAAPSRAMRPRRIARPFAYAASVLIAGASVLALLAFGKPDLAEAVDGYRYANANSVVRYGSGATQRAVTLDDGTRVYLDVASIIEVRFDATRRDVTLVQGRALFDAAHDSTRPFVVTIGTERVTALGTVFQVDREPSAVVVTLTQGAVTVTSQWGVEAVQLAPGEELRSSAGSTRWSKRSVDAQSATRWSLVKHIFRERRLDDAVREINRYAYKRVRLADPRLADLVVNGEFNTGDSESIVDALTVVLPVRVVTTRTELVLYSKLESADHAQF